MYKGSSVNKVEMYNGSSVNKVEMYNGSSVNSERQPFIVAEGSLFDRMLSFPTTCFFNFSNPFARSKMSHLKQVSTLKPRIQFY